MKKTSNLFQKVALSIIALATLGIFIQNQIIIAKISPLQGSNNVSLSKQINFRPGQNFAIVPVNADGSLDVNIKSCNDVVDVNIDEVGGHFTRGTIKVKIEE